MQILNNQIVTVFLQGIKSRIAHSLPLLTLLLMLTFGAGNAMAQTYNGGVWYSLYDATERTNDKITNIEVTETVFPPTNSKIYIDWKKDAIYTGTWFGKKTYTYPGFDLWVTKTDNSHRIAVSNAMVNEHTSYETAEGSVEQNISSVK